MYFLLEIHTTKDKILFLVSPLSDVYWMSSLQAEVTIFVRVLVWQVACSFLKFHQVFIDMWL